MFAKCASIFSQRMKKKKMFLDIIRDVPFPDFFPLNLSFTLTLNQRKWILDMMLKNIFIELWTLNQKHTITVLLNKLTPAGG